MADDPNEKIRSDQSKLTLAQTHEPILDAKLTARNDDGLGSIISDTSDGAQIAAARQRQARAAIAASTGSVEPPWQPPAPTAVPTEGVDVPTGSDAARSIALEPRLPPLGNDLSRVITPDAGQYRINPNAPDVVVTETAVTQRIFIRSHADEAEALTRYLGRLFRRQLEALKGRNEPEARDDIEFLDSAIETLDRIADAIRAAKTATSTDTQQDHYKEAEGLLAVLTEAARGFAVRQHDRVIDGVGVGAFVCAFTMLFSHSMLGVSPDVAFLGSLYLLEVSKKPPAPGKAGG